MAIAVAATLLLAYGVMDPAELPVRDVILRKLPVKPATSTIIVAIDEPSLHAIGPWPWPRTVLARLVEQAADANAKGVIVDLLLAEPNAGDDALARATARTPTVFVAVIGDDGNWLVPSPQLLAHATAAHGSFELDHDGILRRLASTKQSHDRSLAALSVAAASLVTHGSIPIGQALTPAFRTPPAAIPQLSAAALLHDPQSAARLEGKIVFLGPTALALGDRVLAPTSRKRVPDPGVTVHAAATESLIRHEEIRTIAPLLGGLIAGLLVLAAARIAPLAAAGLAAAVIAAGVILLALYCIAVPLVTWMMTVILTTAAVETFRMTAALRQADATAVQVAEQRSVDAESKRLLAHELRTPLASMRTLTQLLGGFELSEAERQRVTTLLETETGKLQTLVEVLLDLERLPLRPFDASTTIVDLGEVVRRRIEFLHAGADRELDVNAQDGLSVRADAALLERIIDNLVGNALKYTPATAPVSIRVARDGATALLEVADRGPGIPEADRERIFARFFRGRTAAGTRGLGLGLSLVGEIAKWHGGSVSLDAPAEGGSRFQIRLPLAEAKA
jgi:signal transduction histidine kinase